MLLVSIVSLVVPFGGCLIGSKIDIRINHKKELQQNYSRCRDVRSVGLQRISFRAHGCLATSKKSRAQRVFGGWGQKGGRVPALDPKP